MFSLLQFALLLCTQALHKRVYISTALTYFLSEPVHLRLLLQLLAKNVILFIMKLSKLLLGLLVDSFSLFCVYFVQLGHLTFFKFDSSGSLLNKLSFLSLELADLRLHFLLELGDSFLMLSTQVLLFLFIVFVNLLDPNSFLLRLKLQNLVLIQTLKSLLVTESALKVVKHVLG